ncbi:MAG: hypothetical protein M3373_03980 [Gemmatimonadota bacterium]|nr:hypothetical protein [Gemmatimonadota bacterium]
MTRVPSVVPALVAVALLGGLATPRGAGAQLGAFGQNKIQYRNFDWHVLAGEHVDVYFYPAEEEIARMALGYAEESYRHLERRLTHRVAHRIPLIVYASHSDFEQTNILPFVPPEGILGVTESLKRRVTLPFRGSHAEFRHTLRHELVHVFQLSMAAQSFILYPRARHAAVPLWWSEGLAEYLSSDQDSRDEMVVRDLALRSRLPTIAQLGTTYGAIVYPIGGDLHRFLAARYGEWRVKLVYESLWKYSSFDEVLRNVYGQTAERLTSEWHYALRQRFYPAVAGRTPVELAGTELADLALKPVALVRADGGVDIAYLSPRSGYTSIYRVPAEGGTKPRVEVPGQRSSEFESFHEWASRMDAREGVLVFGAKVSDRDALYFWDVGQNRVVGRYHFDSIVSVLSPAWAPDGRRVAFSGLSVGGVSDLYVFEMKANRLTRVTDDRFEDLDPTWLPGGTALVFASDRAAGGDAGAMNLYRLDVATGWITPLTVGRWRDEAPRWDAGRGRVLFTSDRDGTFNLYTVDTLGNARRETRLDGGLFDPAPIPGDARIAVTGFDGLSWSLFIIRPDSQAITETFAVAAPDSAGLWEWAELVANGNVKAEARRYRPDYSVDFAAGVASSVPAYAGQGAQVVVSDLLGDHLIAVSLSSFQAGGVGDLLGNINGNVFFLNQTKRLNWGLGAFRIAGTFLESDFQRLYRERSVGAYGTLRYPLSRFTRIEGQVSVERSDRDDFANELVRGPQRRDGYLTGNFISIVSDNALWLSTGPIDGMRWNITGGVVTDVSHAAFENWTGQLDVRKYIRTSEQAAVAVRAFGYVSEGTRPRAVQIAGSWMLRGYPRFSISGTRAWLANTEWRFPITHFVAVGFPFGVVSFPAVQGAVFADAGQAWAGSPGGRPLLGSAGVGFRMAVVPGLVLRADVGRRFSPNGAEEIPSDFFRRRFVELFIGYNY